MPKRNKRKEPDMVRTVSMLVGTAVAALFLTAIFLAIAFGGGRRLITLEDPAAGVCMIAVSYLVGWNFIKNEWHDVRAWFRILRKNRR